LKIIRRGFKMTETENKNNRPTGVTILAILQIIVAIVLLAGALGMFGVAALSGIEEVKDAIGEEVPEWFVDNAAVFFGAIGAIFLILAIIGFILGYGYLKGIGWTWTVGIIIAVLSIIGDILQTLGDRSADALISAVIGIVFSLIIIYYLTRPNVKAFFGKA
jgi:multisubunit Na+/H+ antiporter MnhG subunit